MTLKQDLSKQADISEYSLPSSYQILGDVILAKFPRLSKGEKKRAAGELLKMFPRIKTVCEIRRVSGELREPRVRRLAGADTETVHKEHGILYALDAAKVMFSKGNEHERHRVAKSVKKDETVVDMFAGIGYFSLPASKRALRVVAIEKNPVSFGYLKKNISLNGFENVEPINADCRDVAPRLARSADRIIMGYLPGTERFLPAALEMAKPGCTVHYHNTCRKDSLDEPEKQVRQVFDNCEIISVRKVKDYAPNVYHAAVDFIAR